MKKVVFLLLLAVTVVFAVPAFSQMANMPMKGHGEGHGQRMTMHRTGCNMMEYARHIGLTDDQMAKLKPIHREMKKSHIRFKADLKIARIELMEIMEVKDFDLDKATSAVKKIEDIKAAHHLEMLKAIKDMRAILTDEQFKKIHKMFMMKMAEKKHGKKIMPKPSPKKPADDTKNIKK